MIRIPARFPLWSALVLSLALLVLAPRVAAQLIDDRYLPEPNGVVNALLVLPDSRVLVGGNFTQIGGLSRTRLARLHHDGTVDTSFNNISINGAVEVIIRRPNGKLLIGGSFTQVGGQSRSFLAQLNDNGSLDTSFVPPAISSTVFALGLDNVGRLWVGGEFPQPRTALLRLNENGSLDAGFSPTLNGTVRALSVLRGGRVVIGGEFTQVNGQLRQRLARLEPNGNLDGAFINNANGTVEALITLADESSLVGGRFTQINGQFRNRVARLRPEGGLLDPDFRPRVLSGLGVSALAEQRDGRLLLAGQFNIIDDLSRVGVARLSRQGSVVPLADFDAQTNTTANVRAIAQLSTGQIVLGGQITHVNGQNRNFLARVEADGSLPRNAVNTNLFSDSGQNSGPIFAFSEDPVGRVVVGGAFGRFNITPRSGLLRLSAGGALESGYNPSLLDTTFDSAGRTGTAASLALHENGRLLVGGSFTHFGNTSTVANNLVRLFASGNRDSGFTGGVNASVETVWPISNSEVFVGGLFSHMGGQHRPRFGKLLGSGVDFSMPFLSFNQRVETIIPEANGDLLVGGFFTQVSSTPRRRLLRMTATGGIYSNFTPQIGTASSGYVAALALRRDGSMLIGGAFSEVNGSSANHIAALNSNGSRDNGFVAGTGNFSVQAITVLADQSVLIGGAFSAVNGTTRSRLALLHPDGTVDTSFPNMQFNEFVASLHVQSNGVLLVGGRFNQMLGTERRGLVRLALRTPPRDTIGHLASRHVLWSQGGSAPEVTLPPMLSMSIDDGQTWTEIGPMSRLSSVWRRSSVNRPINQHYLLRVQATLVSSTGSVSRIQRITQIYNADRIFKYGFELD